MLFLTRVFVIALFTVGLIFGTSTPNLNEGTPEVKGIIEDGINFTLSAIIDKLTEPIAIDALALNLTLQMNF